MNELNPGMAVDERAELLRKIQDTIHGIEMDFQAKKPAVEELLRESEAKQGQILNLLNERMRQLEGEKTELGNEIQGFKEAAQAAQTEKEEAERAAQAAQAEKEEAERAAAAALGEKAEMEKNLLETTGNMEDLDSQIATLKEDLNKSITIAETAVREKAQLQGQLNQFQAHWEKHVAGK